MRFGEIYNLMEHELYNQAFVCCGLPVTMNLFFWPVNNGRKSKRKFDKVTASNIVGFDFVNFIVWDMDDV